MDMWYVIRTNGGTPVYAVGPDEWTANPQRAQRFRFQSIAEAYAIGTLDLSPEHYTTELLPLVAIEDFDKEIKTRVTRAARRPL